MQLKKSKFVEGLNIDGLDIILERGNSFLNEIGGDLFVFNDSANNDLVYTESNRFFLVFGFPGKTVHIDVKDLNGEGVQIGLITYWLDFPDDDRFGNRGCLFLCGGSGLALGL